MSTRGGGTSLSSQVLFWGRGGTPSGPGQRVGRVVGGVPQSGPGQGQDKGVPQSGHRTGYLPHPLARTKTGLPPPTTPPHLQPGSDWVPSHRSPPYSPLPGQHTPRIEYAAGDTPLAVIQEEFLVCRICFALPCVVSHLHRCKCCVIVKNSNGAVQQTILLAFGILWLNLTCKSVESQVMFLIIPGIRYLHFKMIISTHKVKTKSFKKGG